MRKILKGEAKANARHRRRYVERVRALSKNVKSYEELLKTEIDGARSGLELAGAAMQLMDLPEEDGDSGAAQPANCPRSTVPARRCLGRRTPGGPGFSSLSPSYTGSGCASPFAGDHAARTYRFTAP